MEYSANAIDVSSHQEVVRKLAEGGALNQAMFFPLPKPYKEIFPYHSLTRGRLNTILGIEFYFGRMKNFALAFLASKNEKIKELVEKASKLKKLKDGTGESNVHETIAKEGMTKLEMILAEIEMLDLEIKKLLVEISQDKTIQEQTGLTFKELDELIQEYLT